MVMRRAVLIGVVVLLWLAGLALYWLVDGTISSRRILAGSVITYLLLWGLILWVSDAPRAESAGRFILTSASVSSERSSATCALSVKVAAHRLDGSIDALVAVHARTLCQPHAAGGAATHRLNSRHSPC